MPLFQNRLTILFYRMTIAILTVYVIVRVTPVGITVVKYVEQQRVCLTGQMVC